MKCFTFSNCQLLRGIRVNRFIPPNGDKLRGPEKEVVFLGQYGKKYSGPVSNIARNVNFDSENPAIVEEVIESKRIIFNPFNQNEPSYSQKTCRVINDAFPRKVQKEKTNRKDIWLTVLAKPYIISNKILVRVNTSSPEMITDRAGGWDRVTGRAWAACISIGVREVDGKPVVSRSDDLVVLNDQDVIRVITEGSEKIDDQVLMNVNGSLVMAPALSFLMSGIEPKETTAEQLEKDMADALSEIQQDTNQVGTRVLDYATKE